MKYLKIILISLPLLIFAACQKADYPIENASQYTKVFMSMANNGVVENQMTIEDKWHRFGFGAGVGGIELVNQDIVIQFEVEEQTIAQYNQSNGTDYTLAPEGSYRLTGGDVTIPKGSTGSNTIYLEVNPLKLNGTKQYMIPVSIVGNSAALPLTEGLETTYYLVSGFYESNPFTPLSPENWTIHDVSDQEYDSPAKNAIDGNLETMWHSIWRKDENGWRPKHPHYLAVDMHETVVLHGLKIYGRPGSKYAYLFPKEVYIETSMDGQNWEAAGTYTVAASGDDTSAIMYLETSVSARYFKFTTLRSSNGGDTTALMEIVAF